MKNPWEVEGVPWKTEASFWSWVRGVLRSGWSKHPVKIEFVKKYRIKVPNPNPDGRVKEVFGMTCACCQKDYPMPLDKKTKKKLKDKYNLEPITIEINHKTAASSLRSKEDLASYAAKLLYVTFEDLEPLCKPCHDIYSYMQKNNVTFEEAVIEKEVIKICKGNEKSWLQERGIEPASNAKKRREQVKEFLQREKELDKLTKIGQEMGNYKASCKLEGFIDNESF